MCKVVGGIVVIIGKALADVGTVIVGANGRNMLHILGSKGCYGVYGM